MKQLLSPSRLLILAVILVVGCSVLLFSPWKSQNVIRVHHDQIEIQQFNNAVFKKVAEIGYGYKVEMVESTVKEFRKFIVSGNIHVMLEFWKENNLAWFDDMIEKGSIEDLGVIYNGGKQYWIVSSWYAKKHNIKTVFDITDHWRDFVDPEDPSKGIFINCIVGWPCAEINDLKLDVYGLNRYYNTVSPASPESLKSIYETSQINQSPLFGYYWEPNAIMISQDWLILKEPDYSKEVWRELVQWLSNPQKELPKEACAYNDSGVHKVVSIELKSSAPEVYEMLGKMKIDYPIFNTLLFSNKYSQSGNTDYDVLAQTFMCNYREVWSDWIPEDVQQEINMVFDEKTCGENSTE